MTIKDKYEIGDFVSYFQGEFGRRTYKNGKIKDIHTNAKGDTFYIIYGNEIPSDRIEGKWDLEDVMEYVFSLIEGKNEKINLEINK